METEPTLETEPTPARRFSRFAIWAGVIGGAFCLALAAWSEFGLALSDTRGAAERNQENLATAQYLAIACGVLLVAGIVARIVDARVSSRLDR
jgi:cell division protein FtsX